MPNSPAPKVYGYNAEATDYDTGLQYLRARYYSTDIQRFVQEDDYKGKYTNPISMNRYTYTHNNPVMGIDPSGYMPSNEEIERLKENVIIANSVFEDAEDKWNLATETWQYKDAYMDLKKINYDIAINAYQERLNMSSWDRMWAYNVTGQSLSDLKTNKDDAFSSYKYAVMAERYAHQAQVDAYFAYLNAQSRLTNAVAERDKVMDVLEEEIEILEEVISYTHQDKIIVNGVEYPFTPDGINQLCSGIDRYNTYTIWQAMMIWNRLVERGLDYNNKETDSNGYDYNNSYALETMYQVLFSEAVGSMSTFDLMVQFAAQFTGEEEGIDRISTEEEFFLKYSQSGNDSWESYDDCSGFVQSLLYIFYGTDLYSESARWQFAEMQEQEPSKVTIGCDISSLKEGDLIYFAKPGEKISHVIMYLGDGKFIHQGSPDPNTDRDKGTNIRDLDLYIKHMKKSGIEIYGIVSGVTGP